jgi:hypothetical protein
MSSYITNKKRGSPKTSDDKRKHDKPSALALKESRNRYPVIDLSTISDVPTAACVEMSKQIMMNPDIHTGDLFKLIAASNFETNKSDAIIVISASILESIGNKKAADKMLRKSGTVMNFYERMNLNNDQVRTSFCIMLFAIAPEFVKMVESSLKLSLERVQSLTTADHADHKVLEATGELMRGGSITASEHCKMLDDMAELKLNTKALDSPGSIQYTPEDGISVDDSISRVGKSSASVIKNTSPLTSRGIMRFVKENKAEAYKKFYNEFPSATRPVLPERAARNSGIGFRSSDSTIPDDVTESNFGDVMDSLLANKTRKTRRDSSMLTSEDMKAPISFVKSTNDTLANEMMNLGSNGRIADVMKYQVTSDDIDEMRTTNEYKNRERSAVITNSSSTNENEDDVLLSLL